MTARGLHVAHAASDESIDLEIDGRELRITHPNRVVWPATGTTKRELIDYLIAIAPALLPHLQDRATMLWRFPEGVEGPGWFQAQCRSRPPWVPTFDVVGRRGEILSYCVIDEVGTLVWLANLGTIEFHPHGWTIVRPNEPSAAVFDLDPGPPAGLVEAASVALLVRDALQDSGLEPFVKTSGSLGLHVAARASPGATFDETKAFSRRVAERLATARPDDVVARSDRQLRVGRVYIDWIQNDRNRQLVAPYSPRATAIPQVSTPITWSEVERAAMGDVASFRPTFDETVARVARVGPLWIAPA